MVDKRGSHQILAAGVTSFTNFKITPIHFTLFIGGIPVVPTSGGFMKIQLQESIKFSGASNKEPLTTQVAMKIISNLC